ncbi:MAG: hypothetical protein JW739_08795 [Opitutales bacterium]|nr:hypothetical protein [Opitutales bacterium]
MLLNQRRIEKQHIIRRKKKYSGDAKRDYLPSSRLTRPEPSRKLRTKNPLSKKIITIPRVFSLAENSDETLLFFSDLRDAVFKKRVSEILIDHSAIGIIDPPAALMLISETMRIRVCAPRCVLSCKLAEDSLVAELLEKLDYWKMYGYRRNHNSELNEQLVMKATNNFTLPEVVKNIIVDFSDCCTFSVPQKKMLFKGIVECMDNVMSHAYPSKFKRMWLKQQWWLIAYKNRTERKISICFYDHGLGIPGTIRTRLRDNLILLKRSDEDIIKEAVMSGCYSRTKLETRGRGLPKLYDIIDGTEFSGELSLFTGNSHCRFNEYQEFFPQRLTNGIHGTLITWNLFPKNEH